MKRLTRKFIRSSYPLDSIEMLELNVVMLNNGNTIKPREVPGIIYLGRKKGVGVHKMQEQFEGKFLCPRSA